MRCCDCRFCWTDVKSCSIKIEEGLFRIDREVPEDCEDFKLKDDPEVPEIDRGLY